MAVWRNGRWVGAYSMDGSHERQQMACSFVTFILLIITFVVSGGVIWFVYNYFPKIFNFFTWGVFGHFIIMILVGIFLSALIIIPFSKAYTPKQRIGSVIILVVILLYTHIPRIWLPIHKEHFYNVAVRCEYGNPELARSIFETLKFYKDSEERLKKILY